MKIIEIAGIKGLISAVVIAFCAFAGFVISPGYAAMYLWNKYLVTSYMFPQIGLFQGILLWAIVVITYYILTSDGFAVSFKNAPQLSDEEIKSIIRTSRIHSKMDMMNKMMAKNDKFEQSNKNPFFATKDDVKTSDNDNNDKLSNG